MITLKTIYPVKDDDGTDDFGLIFHYAEDENGKRYYIIQVETGIEYEGAYDVYPCRYTYKVTEKEIPPEEDEENNEE